MEDLYLKACEDGAINIVSNYVRKGLNVNYQEKNTGSTGLMKVLIVAIPFVFYQNFRKIAFILYLPRLALTDTTMW